METVSKNILKNIYKARPSGVHKYDFGLLLVIGGSEYYSGSPALSALSAFRAGVDMVRIIAPRRAADIIASFSPNLATLPLEGKWLEGEHLPTLIGMTKSAQAVAKGKSAVVIGGGIGRTEETQVAVCEYLSQVAVPLVLDADAIHAVAERPEVFKGKDFLFTPHGYEFFVLTGKEVIGKSDAEKIKIVREEAKRLQTTILLKGKTDIISNGGKTMVNKEGSSKLTVGGTGDTLAGIAGALMARGTDVFQAACAAAYINGSAGKLAAQKFGESVLATDLIEEIPKAIKV
ncbi:MAG: NAD(P)H-hydrate dehydratase [Candidatus Nealsonbacteria bacterium]|nr:MAG: NAD(P)H-hydrate dehydratase [Candidatus Nealsonbacteria bacterium]